LRSAFAFVVYSVALIFFLLIPIFSEHGAELSKVTFLIRLLVQFVMYAVLMHFGLRLVGKSNKDLRSTSVVYAYIVGVVAPLGVILQYPILLGFGPSALFGTAEDTLRLAAYYQAHPALFVYGGVVGLVLAMIGVLIVVAWFSRTHRVGKFRVLLCLVFAAAVGAAIQARFSCSVRAGRALAQVRLALWRGAVLGASCAAAPPGLGHPRGWRCGSPAR